MYLKCNRRKKDGKEHRYWSVVESVRTSGGRIHQRQVLYLGEINDSQRTAWRKTIEVLNKGESKEPAQQMSLFPEDTPAPLDDETVVQVRLNEMSLHKPRQFGGCWLADRLWHELQLDRFWKPRLPPSRKGTNWLNVLKTLTSYHLLSGGSEWRLHRKWYRQTAMSDLLGEDYGLVQKDKLYRCLDKLLPHKEAMFQFLQRRWKDLFGASFDVLLYDLTSTYFESSPPGEGLRQYGYSRDNREDCVQVVIALILSPQGFPLTYEVMPGSTADSKTLRHFLKKIERLYGKADRMWIMDRGIPTEETLAEMRAGGVNYLVGTPKGRLSSLEASFLERPWEEAREEVAVKLHRQEDELYVLVKSEKRVCKEMAMRRRKLKKFWKRLKTIQNMKRISRDQLLMKVGAAKQVAGNCASLIKIRLPRKDQEVSPRTFRFEIDKKRLKAWRRREGRYLLRSNVMTGDPAALWGQYLVLTEIEQAFKELKCDLAVRPIYHSKDERIQAHIFVAFMAYCLNVTLKNKLKRKAAGLTAKEVLEQLSEIQMIDVHLPTLEGETIVLPRYTQPRKEHELILQMLDLALPRQPQAYLKPPETETSDEERAEKLLGGFGFEGEIEHRPRKKRSRPLHSSGGNHDQKCRGDFRRRRPGFARVWDIRPP